MTQAQRETPECENGECRHHYGDSEAWCRRCKATLTPAPSLTAGTPRELVALVRELQEANETPYSDGAAQLPYQRVKKAVDALLAYPLAPAASGSVGCEREDGALNIHLSSETCDVCAAPPAPPAGTQLVALVARWQEQMRRDYPAGFQLTAASADLLAWTPPAAPSPAVSNTPFDLRVGDWMEACFGAEISRDVTEHNHRFLEEALELVQTGGFTASEAHQLVDYVFGRPVGKAGQEVGGVMVTLAALCLARAIDMTAVAERERVWQKIAVIREKQAGKPKHSPLPAPAAVETPETVMRRVDAVLAELHGRQGLDHCLDEIKADKATWEEMRHALAAALTASPETGGRE